MFASKILQTKKKTVVLNHWTALKLLIQPVLLFMSEVQGPAASPQTIF